MERRARGQPQVCKRVMVGECVTARVGRVVEQQEEAVGATDFAAVMVSEEIACTAVMRGPDLRRARVADAAQRCACCPPRQ